MNDPHVVALYYTVTHADGVDYEKAVPLEHDEPRFALRIDKCCLEITIKSHHATAKDARSVVEPYLWNWELMAALQFLPRQFEFTYDRADIIDRKPTPGMFNLTATDRVALVDTYKVHVGRSEYPDPPPAGIARDEAVELMFGRFCRYRAGGTPLGDAANFCLTKLEKDGGSRSDAARRYFIAKTILNKMGTLTACKGGSEARKAKGANLPFSAAERDWLEEAMKRIIMRAAEVAGNPSASLPQITMADLPPIPEP
jgi:hypothetical protein